MSITRKMADYAADVPTTIGSSGQVLKVNSGGTAYEWAAIGDTLPAGASAGQVLKRNAGNSAYEWGTIGDTLPAGASAGQVLKRNAGNSAYEWGTIVSGPDDVVWPSSWASPTNTYSTSGTWSKGSLADTDLVWIYMVGGGNAGSADNQIGWNTAGGSGGLAMLLFGQAKVFDGGTYAIGAGQIFGGSTGGNTTFTLSSTYGSRVFSSNENPFLGFHNNPFVYVDGSGIATQSIETGSVTAGIANPAIFTLSSAPSWSGHVGNGTIRWNYASGSGASSIFGGGAGGGHSHTNDSSPAANATTRGSSLYAGDGGASASGAAGAYPGGGGGGYATNGGSPSGGNGANGNVRVYHV